MKATFALFLIVVSSLFAEDAPKAPVKKEKVSSIPHTWVSGAFLCLKAQENGLGFGTQEQALAGTANFARTPVVLPHFEWNYGVRVDAGYQPKDLLFFGTWTYIQNTAHGKKTTNGATGFFPTLTMSHTDLSSSVTSAYFLWKLDTQLVDAGAAFSWEPFQYCILKNHVGLRGASLNQRFATQYGGGIFDRGIDSVTMKNNFWGIGPRIGLTPNFTLPKGFSLIGDLSASALMGYLSRAQSEEYLAQSLFNSARNRGKLQFSLDAKAALGWQTEFLYKALVFSMQAGWEWHEFFSQRQFRQNSLGLANNDKNVILKGGFLSLCLGF